MRKLLLFGGMIVGIALAKTPMQAAQDGADYLVNEQLADAVGPGKMEEPVPAI